MNKIENYIQIQGFFKIIKDYKEGFITNFFLGEERCNLLIKKNRLFFSDHKKCCFIFYKEDDFLHLYFLSVSNEQLGIALLELIKNHNDVTFVTDIIGSEANVVELSELFQVYGFEKYSKLFRMSRLVNVEPDMVLNSNIEFAVPSWANQIKSILDKNFDKYCEQIPLLEEINQWIDNKRIVGMLQKDKIIGLLIFEINGLMSHLRYWFVDPGHRDKKIGSALLRRFFYECRATKRELFWVKTDNVNAITRYEHFGFKPEPMFDQVLIKRNKLLSETANH